MYEVFLTALVEHRDFHAACAVLSGFCAMPPWETLSRVLYFHGPPRPTGISNQASIDKPTRKDVAFLWKDLHQSLSRQSFVLQARYEIAKERDMGPSGAAMDLDATPGILRWTDFPDPPHGRPLLTQRKVIEIWDQKKLPLVMRDNHHRCAATRPSTRAQGCPRLTSRRLKAETVEEMHRFFRDDMEFSLTKRYCVRPMHDYAPLDSRADEPGPLASLPAWDALTPVDVQGRWILQVKSHVLQDNKPDEIRNAQDQLMAVRGELEGVFDFKAMDRKVHDTRVAMQQQGIQALPQKVILGKN